MLLSFLLAKCPEVELLGYMVILFLTFLRRFHSVSTVGAPVYTPTRSAQRPPTSLPALAVFWLLGGSHTDGHEVDLTVVLICVSPMISLEKAMAPHSSTLAWKIPWSEEPAWAAVHGVAKSRAQLSDFTFTFHFHALEKAMTIHSSVLAWRIPGTGEPGGLLSMGSHRVGHN